MTDRDDEMGNVTSLYGRDEMNLVEFPFGPISSTTAKTLEVEHDSEEEEKMTDKDDAGQG